MREARRRAATAAMAMPPTPMAPTPSQIAAAGIASPPVAGRTGAVVAVPAAVTVMVVVARTVSPSPTATVNVPGWVEVKVATAVPSVTGFGTAPLPLAKTIDEIDAPASPAVPKYAVSSPPSQVAVSAEVEPTGIVTGEATRLTSTG